MLFDHELFFRMFRMPPIKFEELLSLVAPRITRWNARREPIQADERLSVTLRYLITGDAFSTIAASYRSSDTTVGRIVKETWFVLLEVLSAQGFLNAPKTAAEWVPFANEFEARWNFPNCVGQ